jgi:hypothetical protein
MGRRFIICTISNLIVPTPLKKQPRKIVQAPQLGICLICRMHLIFRQRVITSPEVNIWELIKTIPVEVCGARHLPMIHAREMRMHHHGLFLMPYHPTILPLQPVNVILSTPTVDFYVKIYRVWTTLLVVCHLCPFVSYMITP